jgi:hypothetical protein
LLLQEVGARGLGGFQLQYQVHALMPAILLRIARLDPLNANAKPERPHRELREIERGTERGVGNAIIGPDGGGQAILPEYLFEYGEGIDFFRGFKRL